MHAIMDVDYAVMKARGQRVVMSGGKRNYKGYKATNRQEAFRLSGRSRTIFANDMAMRTL